MFGQRNNHHHHHRHLLLGLIALSLRFGPVSSGNATTKDCGKTATCYGMGREDRGTLTPSCQSTDCLVSVIMKATKSSSISKITFEITFNKPTKDLHYAAIGFTKTKKMEKLLILECLRDAAGNLLAYISWNEAMPVTKTPLRYFGAGKAELIPPKDERDDKNVQISPPSFIDGKLKCEFTLPTKFVLHGPLNTGVKDIWLDLGSGKYIPSIAVGRTVADPTKCAFQQLPQNYYGPKLCHHEDKAAGEPIDLMESHKVQSNSHILKKFHAFLMVITYFTCIPISTIVARYFRETWSSRHIFRKRVWFIIHAVLLMVGLFCIILSYICIYAAQSRAWPVSKSSAIHAVIGVTSMALYATQALLPWIISNTKTSFLLKQTYSIVHAVIGSICYFLGLLNIALTPYLMPKFVNCTVIFITFVWMGWHFCLYWILATLLIIKDHQMLNNNQRFRALLTYPMRLKTMDDAPGKKKRQVLLGLVIFFSVLMTLLMGAEIFAGGVGGQCKIYQTKEPPSE